MKSITLSKHKKINYHDNSHHNMHTFKCLMYIRIEVHIYTYKRCHRPTPIKTTFNKKNNIFVQFCDILSFSTISMTFPSSFNKHTLNHIVSSSKLNRNMFTYFISYQFSCRLIVQKKNKKKTTIFFFIFLGRICAIFNLHVFFYRLNKYITNSQNNN